MSLWKSSTQYHNPVRLSAGVGDSILVLDGALNRGSVLDPGLRLARLFPLTVPHGRRPPNPEDPAHDGDWAARHRGDAPYQRGFFLTSSWAAWRISTAIVCRPSARSRSRGRPEPAERHDILIGRDRALPALREQLLPPVQQRPGHIQLPAQLGDGRLAPDHPVDLAPLKLGRKNPSPVRLPLSLHLRDPLLDPGY